MKTFLNVAEIAKKLRLSKVSVYKYISEGKLKASKFGKSYRIEYHEFKAFLEEACRPKAKNEIKTKTHESAVDLFRKLLFSLVKMALVEEKSSKNSRKGSSGR